LLKHIHDVIGNWGWAIVILTILIKAVFFKLSEASYKSMANMRRMAPQMQKLKERYGAIANVAASGTRREELLMDPKEMQLVYRLRKVLADMNPVEAMEVLKNRLTKTKTNAEFLLTMNLD
ncbi:MAG: hypothetical protein HC828_10190, partial [Blastochloris sp.]|nr:hypothetical protein [Blastochloris sp.]